MRTPQIDRDPGRGFARWLSGALLAAAAIGAIAAGELHVTANALFEGQAVLVIDGKPRMLKAGQRAPEGVKLVSSSAREAVIEIDGRTRTLGLSREVGAAYAEPSRRQVAVPRNAQGQYSVGGAINGHAATLLVDTGANVVAMSGNDALRMGVDFRGKGTRTAVRTASGVVPAWDVMLDRVETGGILVRNVQATVIEGAHPSLPLLGMSWLARVGMREDGGVLYLQER